MIVQFFIQYQYHGIEQGAIRYSSRQLCRDPDVMHKVTYLTTGVALDE